MGGIVMCERKIAVVTGATRGIGRAIAIQLANDGYNIAFSYKHGEKQAAHLSQELKQAGGKVYVERFDVADFEACKSFIASVIKYFGTVDLLVNNAGITRDAALTNMPIEDWTKVIATNLTGVFNMCRASIFRLLKKRQGHIINIASTAGVDGNARQTNYAASKAGIIGFSKSLAKEAGNYGIRVNVIAPGFIETDMTDQIEKEKLKSIVAKDILLKRLGQAFEVAYLVSFLASDKAAYITGQTIKIDGGLSL